MIYSPRVKRTDTSRDVSDGPSLTRHDHYKICLTRPEEVRTFNPSYRNSHRHVTNNTWKVLPLSARVPQIPYLERKGPSIAFNMRGTIFGQGQWGGEGRVGGDGDKGVEPVEVDRTGTQEGAS